MKSSLALATVILLGWNSTLALDREWKELCYRGHTRYTVQRDSAGTWIHAEAIGQNSALFCSTKPVLRGAKLEWRWRVLRHPAGADTDVRSGDDRAAAVFVLVHRSVLPWRTRGLLYQWVPARDCGRWTQSPYASGIKVITLENAPADSVWRSEQRDLSADLRACFGTVPPNIEAVGILCDADDTGDHAIADFGPLEIVTADGQR